MGEAKGVETRELEYISNGYPRDLLQRLSSSNLEQIRMVKTEEPEEIELNLGLSLGGRFGVDPKESNKLVRSTSIAGLATVLKENDSAAPQQVFHPAGLFRTTSLPTETEEEWRKRKEMQCLRRMEAKRKRSEKQQKSNNNNLKAVSRGSVDEDKRIEVGVGGGGGGGLMACSTAPPLIPCVPKQQSCMVSNGMFSASVSPPPPVGLASWGGRGSKAIAASFASPVAGIGGQGSMGSQGSSSTSGISEFDSRPQQGSSNCTEARSPSSVQSLPDQNEKKSSVSPTSTINAETVVPMKVEAVENASKKPKLDDGLRETGMKVMEEMPCVSTKGDGPNGRKIEGFLYKYKKGEEVRIVCVCHGEFLSPAEFVKHAGGGDVAHPLRHIVVNPSPSFL